MEQILILNYIPTDLNTYINAERRNRFIGAKIKKTETERVYWMCKEQLKPIQVPAQFDFYWLLKDKRKDPDNIAFTKKFILDGMVMAQVLENDGRGQIKGFSDHFEDSLTDSVKVIITPVF